MLLKSVTWNNVHVWIKYSIQYLQSIYICFLLPSLPRCCCFLCGFSVWNQSYQWLKDKIVSEDGRKQQAKLKELSHIAEKLSCTLPQIAVGETKHTFTKERCISLNCYYIITLLKKTPTEMI